MGAAVPFIIAVFRITGGLEGGHRDVTGQALLHFRLIAHQAPGCARCMLRNWQRSTQAPIRWQAKHAFTLSNASLTYATWESVTHASKGQTALLRIACVQCCWLQPVAERECSWSCAIQQQTRCSSCCRFVVTKRTQHQLMETAPMSAPQGSQPAMESVNAACRPRAVMRIATRAGPKPCARRRICRLDLCYMTHWAVFQLMSICSLHRCYAPEISISSANLQQRSREVQH